MKNYRVFIIINDQMIRFNLKEIIELSDLNLEVVGEASDGLEAWRLLKNSYQRIDIIISENKLPFISGLELLQKVKEIAIFETQIPLFIMISDIMEYEYVRQSFIVGAFDYILKIKLDTQHIEPTLQRAIKELEVRAKQLYHSKFLNVEYMRVVTALHQYSVKTETSNTNTKENLLTESNEMSQILQSKFGDKIINVAIIRIAEPSSSIDDRSFTMQLIEILSINQVDKIKGYIWRQNDRQYNIFFSFTDNSLMEIRNKTHYLLNELLMFMKNEQGIKASIGVSDLSKGIHRLDLLLKEAKQLTEMCFLDGYYRVFYSEMLSEKTISNGWKVDWLKFKEHWLQKARQEENNYVATDFDKELDKLLDFCPQDRSILVSLLIELVWEIGSIVDNHDWLQNEMLFFIETIKNSDTWEEAKHAVIDFLNQHFVQIRNKQISNQNYISPMVIKTKEIIDRQFAEELNLSQISTMLGVSESYLSKQFVKELGVNFISYLTQLRIEKAKLDIKKGLRINHVAERVGYVNPEHFSRIFKKMTGMSPIVYRKFTQNNASSMVSSK